MKPKCLRHPWRLLTACAILMAAAGCETNEGAQDSASRSRAVLSIEPTAAVVDTTAGQNITFTVAGGRAPYRWKVANPELGVVTARGAQGVYSVSGGSGANFVVVTDSGGNSAGARIIQGDVTDSSLTVTPHIATMPADQVNVTFTASGGQPAYQWSLTDAGLGALQASGTTAVYTRNANAGAHFIRVTDALGNRAEAAIMQEPPVAVELNAVATPATLANDGDQAVLTASGGTPPYQWSVTDIALGSITGATTGNNTAYMRNHNGDNIVVLRDAADSVFHLVIQQP